MKTFSKSALLLSAATLALVTSPALAQEEVEEAEARQKTVVVTGVIGAAGANKIDSSISVSSLDDEFIADVGPTNLAEIYRQLPGIRSESSSGGGNSNVAVRGLPLSTGGAKFLQTQEDGLPIMLFGDFDFAPADGYYKSDATLGRVESVRGGTASTLTTNGAGGIINLISKTGREGGGSAAITTGLDHDDFRFDADYGGDLGEDMYFHIGGHFQQGGDYRDSGFDTISGGQIRASLTKEFENGFVRVHGKWLDKKDAAYFPQAVSIDGNSVGEGVAGFDANSDSLQSPYTRFGRDVDGTNTVNNYDLADGIRAKVKSVGAELDFDLGNGFSINNKVRYQDISGNFNGAFTHNVDGFENRFGTASGATIFNGPAAGGAVSDASLMDLTGNNLVSEIAYFNVDLEDMSNFANELRLSKSIELEGSRLDVTVGHFFMNQNFKQDWHWNALLATTTNNSALISVPGQTTDGVLGYNRAFGWNGNNRNYDLEYQANAPFVGASWTNDVLTIDGSVRFDTMEQTGIRTEAAGAPFDVNGDGVIGPAEADVSLNTGTVGAEANFEVDNTAYSFGVNYLINDDLAVFGRASSGASFNGERQLGNSQTPGGGLIPGGDDTYVDVADQYEIGVKWQGGRIGEGDLDLYVTGFYTETEESNTQVTGGGAITKIENAYESKGIEFEAAYTLGGFDLNATATWTDAEIVASTSAPETVGNTPQRQADFIWAVTPTYNWNDKARFGLSWVGTSEAPSSFGEVLRDINDPNSSFRLMQDGYSVVNLFANYNLTDDLSIGVNVNNAFDSTGITESLNDARIFDVNGDGVREHTIGRSILGRTATANLRYRF